MLFYAEAYCQQPTKSFHKRVLASGRDVPLPLGGKAKIIYCLPLKTSTAVSYKLASKKAAKHYHKNHKDITFNFHPCRENHSERTCRRWKQYLVFYNARNSISIISLRAISFLTVDIIHE
jgi:hypothetical protein